MYFLGSNQKKLLSSLNPLFLVAFVFAMIVFRTTCDTFLPHLVREWDILLPFVAYFGQRRSLAEGLILSLFASHLYSLSSSAPIGVFATHYLALFIIARLVSYVLYANAWFSVLLLMFAVTFVSRLLITIVAGSFGHGWPLFSFENFKPWALILNTLIAYVIYGCLERLDRLTYKAPRINIELAKSAI